MSLMFKAGDHDGQHTRDRRVAKLSWRLGWAILLGVVVLLPISTLAETEGSCDNPFLPAKIKLASPT